ncbi:MAG TPA: hypothetical protein VL100_13710 [Croceibacterium sp.]|nr:hypothetical protein [Croceibacterium sp.]
MATTKNRRFRWLSRNTAIVLLAMAAVVAVWAYRSPLMGYATVGTSYGARVACSCRFVGGRELKDCEKDFEPGMAAVFLSEDADARSITAYIPLVESQTATYRQGYGCVLEKWDG